MAKTKIEWTEASWNPISGCTKVSEDVVTVMPNDSPTDFRRWGRRITKVDSKLLFTTTPLVFHSNGVNHK